MSAKRDDAPKDAAAQPPKADKAFIQLDGDKKGAASAAPAARSRVVAGALAAACVALIVISLGFVHTSSGTAWSLSWITESLGFSSSSVASVKGGENSDRSAASENASGDSKASGKDDKPGDAKGSKESDNSKGEKGSKKDKDSSHEKNDSKDSKSDSSGASAQGANGAGAVATDTASGGSAANTGNANAASGNGPASNNGGGTSNANEGSKDDGLISVTVSVTSSAVGNPVSAGGTYRFQQGATAYDALCALGLSVNAHGSQYGTYVAAIGGLAEKEHGGSSGWMYSVNGSTPMTACSNYVLSNGDNVVWYYVTG